MSSPSSSVLFSEADADCNDGITQVPLPAGFQLGVASRRHWEAPNRTEEKGEGISSLLPPCFGLQTVSRRISPQLLLSTGYTKLELSLGAGNNTSPSFPFRLRDESGFLLLVLLALPTPLQIIPSLKSPQSICVNGILFLSKTMTDIGVQR